MHNFVTHTHMLIEQTTHTYRSKSSMLLMAGPAFLEALSASATVGDAANIWDDQPRAACHMMLRASRDCVCHTSGFFSVEWRPRAQPLIFMKPSQS